jgi:hypothetical protein
MDNANLFAIRHRNQRYTVEMNDGVVRYFETLCFKAPSYLSARDLGILDADYWLRGIKKGKEHPLIADLEFPYMRVPLIYTSDIESRKGNLITLKCDLTERSFEREKSFFVEADQQFFLSSIWSHLSNLCFKEGFNLSRQDWEEYKSWSKSKFEELRGE